MPHELALVQSPLFYSSLNASNSLPTIVASSGFSADMKAKADLGHQAVIDFIGGVAPVTAFLFEPNGAASVYADMESPMCDDFLAGDYCPFDRLVSDATSGGGSYMRGNSPKTCCNSHVHLAHVGLYYLTTASDTSAFVAERAVHEYTHAVQGKYSDMTPQWLMEGGAVQMECLLAHKMPNPTGYADCMKYGGGRGGVIPNTRAYFASARRPGQRSRQGRRPMLRRHVRHGRHRCDLHSRRHERRLSLLRRRRGRDRVGHQQGWGDVPAVLDEQDPGRRLLGRHRAVRGIRLRDGFFVGLPCGRGMEESFRFVHGPRRYHGVLHRVRRGPRRRQKTTSSRFESDADVVLQTNSTFDITTEDFLSEGIQAAETCDFQSAVSAAGVQSAVKLAARTVAAILATFAALR